jgi:hypothetical protein
MNLSVAHFALQNTKFGSEKGKVQKPARIPPRDLASRGRDGSRGGAIPFPQNNSLPRRVQISFQDFRQKKFEHQSKNQTKELQCKIDLFFVCGEGGIRTLHVQCRFPIYSQRSCS